MSHANRIVTRVDGQDDWPATPDGRYGQLAAANNWDVTNTFDYPINTPFVFTRVVQDSNTDNDFSEYLGTTPTGITEVDAAEHSNTWTQRGFWRLTGTGTNTTWKYRWLANKTSSTSWESFTYGPIVVASPTFTNDVEYTYSLCSGTISTIDEDNRVDVVVKYNATSGKWEMRSDTVVAATTTTGTAVEVGDIQTLQPFFVRLAARNNASVDARGYYGSAPISLSQALLSNVDTDITWGEYWHQISMSRGSDSNWDYVFNGGIFSDGNVG